MKAMNSDRDQLFDAMLKYACKDMIESISEEYPSIEELEAYSPSLELDKRIHETIKKEKRKQASNRTWGYIKSAAKRISMVAGILVICSSFAAFTIPPLREAILGFIVEKAGENYSLSLKTEENKDNVPSQIYRYIPEGFNVVDITESDTALMILCDNSAGETIRIQRHSGQGDLVVDGEDNDLTKITIAGHEAYVSYKNGLTTIFTHDDQYLYIISSEIDKDKLIELVNLILK